jgi:transcriptional regulator with AAA-type ATPase domain/tetratricopeptide (TPR) repeat protein
MSNLKRAAAGADDAGFEDFEDSSTSRERLSRFLFLEHPILASFSDLQVDEGRILLRRRRRQGVPLAEIRHSRESAAAILLQAASAILFFGSRGFPMEYADFEGSRVEIWNGSPHLWLSRAPRSATREPLSIEPAAATMSALLTKLFSPRRSGARSAPDSPGAGGRKLFDRLLNGMGRQGRPDTWIVEILRHYPFLFEESFGNVRKRCAGFRPAGFDEREREHRARSLLARLRLEGKRARLCLPGRSSLLPGQAILDSFGTDEVDLDVLRRKVAEAGEKETHWIRLDSGRWDETSMQIFSAAVRRKNLEVIEIEGSAPRCRPDEIREAVWVPSPDLASSVELYNALHAAASRSPQSLRRGVARFLSSAQFADFIERGSVPEFLLEAEPEQARRELARLTADERRAIGVFLVNPAGASVAEVDRVSGTQAFFRAALQLAASGWIFEDALPGRWRTADPSARADLLTAYTPEETRAFSENWLRHLKDPLPKIDFAIRAGRFDVVKDAAAEVFRNGTVARARELDAIARLVVDALRDEAPAAVRAHEAERLAEIGEESRARRLWDGIVTGAATPPPLARATSARLAASLAKAGVAPKARALWVGLLEDPRASAPERARALRGIARLEVEAGRLPEARQAIEKADGLTGLSTSERIENALFTADLESRLGNFDGEKAIYEKWRAAVRSSGDEDLQERFLLREGMFLSDQRDHEGAALRFSEAVQSAGADLEHRGAALMDLAISTDYLGDAEASEEYFRQARQCLDQTENAVLRRRLLGNLASFYVDHHRYEEAEPLLDVLRHESEAEGDSIGKLTALSHRARMRLRQGRFPSAARDRREALALSERLEDRIERAELELEESDGRLFEGDREGALRFAREAASRLADRSRIAEHARQAVADLENWRRLEDPREAFSEAELARGFKEDAEGTSRRLARALAFYGEEFEKAFRDECATARAHFERLAQGAFADAVFSRGSGRRPDIDRLRNLRARLRENKIPLRVVDFRGRQLLRTPAFKEASWSREILCDGRPFVLEGQGPDADPTAFLFETLWTPPEDLPGVAEPGEGLEICRRVGIVTADPSLETLGVRLSRVAPQNVSVFVSGESGTGKERVARAVHQLSPRAGYPFVAINTAAFPEHLLEDELFGHARGAFTGAEKDRPGLFESAEKGTLFLDEIGDLPSSLQGKLLRVLQEREVRRLGENRHRAVDVRLITATAKSLEKEVEAGRFREDLYYRIKVATLDLPPLRDRGADVSLLVRHFLEKYAAEFKKGELRFSTRAAARIRSYRWPGNVRQLQNAMMEAVALADESSVIDIDGLPAFLQNDSRGIPSGSYRERVDEFRRRVVIEALARTNGNRTHAAREISLTRQALLYLIRELEISPADSAKPTRPAARV